MAVLKGLGFRVLNKAFSSGTCASLGFNTVPSIECLLNLTLKCQFDLILRESNSKCIVSAVVQDRIFDNVKHKGF